MNNVYRFELNLLSGKIAATENRSMAQLQRLAGYVWRAERLTAPAPRVVAGQGIWHEAHTCQSYYWSTGNVIVLARHQRTAAVLLHELAHAMGARDKLHHGPAFTRRVLYLYARYGRVPIPFLLNSIDTYKLI